ncbi:M23 family metallopeptidase [Candidatus Uhrbacteria bacterium]|nr:M23 family metallopeptidase [Candidatus Uhrbacteria bacterium]
MDVEIERTPVVAEMHSGEDGKAFRGILPRSGISPETFFDNLEIVMTLRKLARVALAFGLILTLTALEFTWFGLMLSGCATSGPDEIYYGEGDVALGVPVPCAVSLVRYPTTIADLADVYDGRGFYADGNHLGYDTAYVEGTEIHPVGCGIIRFYGPASGYGELVVVIEHKLEQPITVVNGAGVEVTINSFLSIYGHLRSSEERGGNGLAFHVGDMVGPEDVIGYVNDDAHNGDGAEHLHLGIRLQNATDAKATDGKWFRGYDGNPSQRKWFADPVTFLATLASSFPATLWHPAGTVLRDGGGTYWVVGSGGKRQKIAPETVATERLATRAVATTDAELACYADGGTYVSPRAGHLLLKFDDASTVYEYTGVGAGQGRWAFISYEAFLSWGWTDAEIAVRPASERPGFFAQTEDRGLRTMRDGSLVKGDAASDVYAVSEGARLPIHDWDTFLALGYAQGNIYVVPQDTVGAVAGPKGSAILPDDLAACLHPTPGNSGGGLGEGGSDGAGGSTGSGSGAGIPKGKVLFQYNGPVLPGLNEFQAMWYPPNAPVVDWVPSTFALCPDLVPGDGQLECLLDMPSGTEDFLFQVHLPDGSWWGDMSYDPQGGQGDTIGTVTLTGPAGNIPYVMVSNGTGPLYMNGWVATVP